MRRTRLDIINDMLKASSKDGVKKTHIMYKARLSFKQLNEYLSLLKKRGLVNIENNNGNTTYKTSEIGTAFLKKYEDMDLNKIINNNVPID
jgi:predicted transcriptional regulator